MSSLPVIIIGFTVAFASLLVLRPFAVAIGLVDRPSARKLHSGSVPLIGGIAVFLSVVVYVFLTPNLSHKVLPLLATGSVLFLMGAIDDYRPLGVRTRVGVQVSCALLMVWMTGIKIDSLGSLFGSSNIELGLLAVPFTVLAVVGVTNAFNLIDGIDGLAGSMALIAIMGILVFQSQSGVQAGYEYLLVLGAALIPYLILNLWGGPRFKVFMGDAGSLFIGFIIVWTLIHQTQTAAFSISPTSALWCVAIPIIDTVGVMSRRVLKGDSPFKPDRNHLHHILMRAGFSSFGSLVFLVSVSGLLLLLGLFIEAYLPLFSFPAFLIVFAVYVLMLRKAWKVQKFLKSSPSTLE
ncbi:undecaprenyl-phosphate alpha-N-acetylglucosaminyl 1-phosphate transferase [Marinobacterium sp. xm-a-152]|uniref:undecaprenyl-phosphate alpha-N-acetylglucosaminyl 1-phosphate transferase n=1 Tax=Marinobacterium sp. xm-a-152 TaxID=2497733 RepID=UPI00156814BA|nr:undecaprenyl-phosphate alpha-N-acetylglucosaminyl 1-phosphate transferase [Marinobacterium sp. xm-a-152]NRP15381.1 Undecaprenyl-phosphate alpha-N-acetylglucosaminyl 1-phosphate transferase [Marinobacterium sp. xm-a-152]